MPRTKQSQRSQAAKKRMADRMAASPEEVLPPLKKLAEISERCVHHNESKYKSKYKSEPNPEPNCNPNPEPNPEPNPKLTVNAVFNLSPQTSYIRGSFHQGDYRFGENMGKQCAANSLTAIMTSKMKSVLQWKRSDLNAVLMNGDDLYSALRDAEKINDPESGFILVDELPHTHTC
ncbi:hypothetical protein QQF64_034206 [Cirrhinus molitorella]|uniref:Peptidase C76 domain-containing protein n=1 Tax=Cirrhinus molitorella TaxID=172907 RepID=A0ABR3MW22_9TELE